MFLMSSDVLHLKIFSLISLLLNIAAAFFRAFNNIEGLMLGARITKKICVCNPSNDSKSIGVLVTKSPPTNFDS